MVNVGDKYVIEIGAVAELPDGKKKYFIKPFESLVFDKWGLDQLEKLDEVVQAKCWTACEDSKSVGYADGYKDGYKQCSDNTSDGYKKGYDKAIEDAQLALLDLMKMSTSDAAEAFDGLVILEDIIQDYTLGRIISIMEAYRNEQKAAKEIEVGDEVKIDDDDLAVVTRVNTNSYSVLYYDGMVGDPSKSACTKTGRHFDQLDEIFAKLNNPEVAETGQLKYNKGDIIKFMLRLPGSGVQPVRMGKILDVIKLSDEPYLVLADSSMYRVMESEVVELVKSRSDLDINVKY